MLGVICTPKLAQHAADLADRAAGAQRLAHRGQEVRVGRGDAAHLVERARGGARVALGAHARRALALAPLDLGVDLQELDPLAAVLA